MNKYKQRSFWLIVSTLLLAILSACSSNSPTMNYYFLHQPAATSAQSSQDITQYPIIVLRSLKTPEYLKQRNLSIQTSPSELYFAPQHAWAEPFANDFTMALADVLASSYQVRLQGQHQLSGQESVASLDIYIQDFVPTYNGKLVLSGQYQIGKKNTSNQVVKFSFILPLEQNGFAHSVTQMRLVINQLADDIINRLDVKT